MAVTTHPRLVSRTPQPAGWVKQDSLFVVLMLAAIFVCALVPLVLA